MGNSNIFSSQITFLNFGDYECGKSFMEKTLGLPLVYDIGWAAVYRTAEKAFLGVVDSGKKSLGLKDGVLISLSTDDVEKWHSRISEYMTEGISEIKGVPDAGLRSFFIRGPEGFNFEIQQFQLPEAKKIF